MIKRYFGKRIYNIASFNRDIEDIVVNRSHIQSAFQRRSIERPFIERIMLAVTQVNGCRYCSYAHTRQALEAGVPVEHIRQLSSGNWLDLPQDELIALNFAQHYAESGGKPDPAPLEKLVDFYGEETSSDILVYIRMITVANLLGNTFDALLSRFISIPAENSSIFQELGVLLGSIIIIPSAILRKWSSASRVVART